MSDAAGTAVGGVDPQTILAAIRRLAELDRYGGTMAKFFPDEGPYRRELYAKHLEFFELGARKPYRLFVGANGVGKTESAGGFEVCCHLTGLYPDWWVGHRFDRPSRWWAAGDTFKTLRESLQPKVFGDAGDFGTGLLPRDLIGEVRLAQNSNGVIDYVLVKHVSGGWSRLTIKTYEQGRASFQAADVDGIWLDEEPPYVGIFAECVQRFRGKTADGILMLTFTPLKGISDVVQMFIPEFATDYNEAQYEASGRAYVFCSMDDVPHISAEERARKLANSEAHQREARTTGRPTIGAGKIFPVAEESFVIEPLRAIPKWWPRVYGFDVGWNRTAAVWGAWDQDEDVIYLYSEHYVSEQSPPVHAAGIKARGVWIPGVIDPASRNRSQADGEALLQTYRNLGLSLTPANNVVGDGLLEMLMRLEQGRLRVYSTLKNWIGEFRTYRRDEKGRVVKKKDHLMDATRYLVRSGLAVARTQRAETSVSVNEETFGLYN